MKWISRRNVLGRIREEWRGFLTRSREESQILRAKPRIVVILCVALLVRLYLGLWGWGLMEPDNGCKLQDQAHSKPMEDFLYRNLMRLKFPANEKRQVALVTLTEGVEPTRIFRDTCANREFLSELIPVLVHYQVKVIAIDQSYSPDSCPDSTSNNHLREAIEIVAARANVPVVVGEHAGGRSDSLKNADCLIETETLDFLHLEVPNRPGVKGVQLASQDNVHFGLLSLNDNSLKIPLSWWIFPPGGPVEDEERTPPAKQKDGFAFAAAKLENDQLQSDSSLQKLQATYQHPYADFVSFQPWNAMDLLCYGDSGIDPAPTKPKECSTNIPHMPFGKLKGKLVFVGNHLGTDLKPFPGGPQYGVDLHAKYAEALLDYRFLRPAPWWVDDGSILLFCMVTLVLELAGQRRPKDLPPGRAFLLSLGLLALLVIMAVVLLKFRLLMLDFVLTMIVIVIGLLPTMITLFLNNRSEKNPVHPGGV